MPTILTCPSCRKLSQVANQPPGSVVRCPHCLAVMKVPGEAPKVAPPPPPAAPDEPGDDFFPSPDISTEGQGAGLVDGSRLGGIGRLDATVLPPQPVSIAPANGQTSALKAPQTSPRGTPPVSSSAPAAPPPKPPPLLFSPKDDAPAQAPRYICSVCGRSFPIDKVFDLNGSNICQTCHAATIAGPGFLSAPDTASFPVVPSLAALMSQPASPEPPSSIFDEPVPAGDDVTPAEEAVAPADGATDLPPDEVQFSDASDDDIAESDDTIADIDSMSASDLGTRKPAPNTNRLPMLIAWGSVAFILAGVLTYYLVLHGGATRPQAAAPPPVGPQAPAVEDQAISEWEKRNDPRLSQWRSEARGREISGDLAGAQLLYQKMLALAQSPGATLQTPAALALLDEAQTRFDAISRKIGYPPPLVAMGEQSGPPAINPAQPADQTPAAPAVAPTVPAATAAPAATAPSAPAAVQAATQPSTAAPVAEANPVDWEQSHRDQLLEMSADAGALEKRQQPVAALAKLMELLQFVGDHRPTLTDPQLKAAVAAADESRKRLSVATRDSNDVRALTARSLLAAGLKAEQEKKWKTALEMLSDASHLISPMLRPVQRYRDPTYLAALDAMAVAYINLKLFPRASELFADDEPLGRASLAMNSPTRDLIWNRAVNDLAQKFNIMRSVKMLHDYMDAHQDPDEPLLNLLGTALFIADESNPSDRRVLDDAIGFYSQRSMDLEKTHPGQRRWGIQWLSEDDAKTQFDNYNKAQDAYQQALRAKTAAETHVKDIEAAQRDGGPGATPAALKAAKAQAVSAATAVKAAHDAIPRPPWLTDVQPVVPTVDPATLMLAAAPTTAPAASPGSSTPAPAPSTPAPGPAAPASPSAVTIVPPSAPEARYAAAFPVDRTHLVTASDPLGSATHVMIEDASGGVMPARVVATSGRLALLEVTPADAGGPLKYLPLATDFTGGPVQCAAIPLANLFGPTVALLTADAPVPLKSAWWVQLSDHPRLAGSPLLNAQNEVIGVEVATRDDARQKIPAITLEDLRKFLQSNQIVPPPSSATPDPTVVSQVAVQSE